MSGLKSMLTVTASTERSTMSGGKSSTPASNLTQLLITPVMLASNRGLQELRQAIGLEGSTVQLFECYTMSHTHQDGGSPVTQMPDIIFGDRLIVSGVTYIVKWAEIQNITSRFGQTLIIYLTKDKRS